MEQVVTVKSTVAGKNLYEEGLDDAGDIPANITDTADKAGKAVSRS